MSEDLPDRVIVDQHGHYWRDYGGFHSMCPVSDENTRTEVAAVYVRAVRRESRDGSGPARWVASGDVECAHPYVACPHGGCELPANHVGKTPTAMRGAADRIGEALG